MNYRQESVILNLNQFRNIWNKKKDISFDSERRPCILSHEDHGSANDIVNGHIYGRKIKQVWPRPPRYIGHSSEDIRGRFFRAATSIVLKRDQPDHITVATLMKSFYAFRELKQINF